MSNNLQATQRAAIDLHKALIDAVRVDYERENGRVEAPAELWRLVAYDPWFAWLRPLSQAIVAFDEPEVEAAAVRGELSQLLAAPDFQARYLELLQRSPEVVLAHASLARLLG